MKAPLFLSLASLLLVLAVIGVAFRQGKEARSLRAEVDALAGALAVAAPVADGAAAAPAAEPLTAAERLELLRLRNEVTRLRVESRGLEAARQENAQLKGRLGSAQASPGALQSALPAGYILRRTARNVGQATLEATVETFLWAIEHRDVAVLQQTLTPEAAQTFARGLQQDREEFWAHASLLPGLRISGQQAQPDGSVEFRMSFDLEGDENLGTTKARLVEGRWRLELR